MVELTDVNDDTSKAVTIALTDDNGTAVVPSAITCVLYGADATDIIRTFSPTLSASQTINISKADNTVAGESIGMRRLVVDYTYLDGAVAKGKAEEYRYRINPVLGK